MKISNMLFYYYDIGRSLEYGFRGQYMVEPSFTGINFGDKPQDASPPVDIIKLVLTEADVIIPDNKEFHPFLSNQERETRSECYFDHCNAIRDVYGLGNKIMLTSKIIDFESYNETKNTILREYKKNRNFKKAFLEVFPERSKEYVLSETAVVIEMAKMGYITKVGPVSEIRFDKVSKGFLRDNMNFVYTIQAMALTKLTKNVVGFREFTEPQIVTDYITTSMSNRGVRPVIDRVLFSNEIEHMKNNIEIANIEAVIPLYVMGYVAGCRLGNINDRGLLCSPKDDGTFKEETFRMLVNNVINPINGVIG